VLKGSHFHCFGCANLFSRSERAVRHYGIHHVTGKTDDLQVSQPVVSIPTMQSSSSQCNDDSPVHLQSYMHRPNLSGTPAISPVIHVLTQQQASDDQFTMTLPNIGPDTSHSLKTSNVERVQCQYCGKGLHPHSLKTHIDSQHNYEARHLVISPYRFHQGVCVDAINGVFFMRRNLSGPCYPMHVQYCPNGNPPKVLCQLTECQQVMDTAARSGDVGYLCKHLLSVPYIPTQLPIIRPLSSDSLDIVINDIKLLRPSSRMECLEYQLMALREEVPLVVLLPAETSSMSDSSPSRLSFSVWDNQRKRWWSFCSRVSVTFDCQQRIWHCKHVKGLQSCMHKSMVKWYMAEHMPQLLRCAQPAADEDEADDTCSRTDFNNLECPEEAEEISQDATVPDQPPRYPPGGDLLRQMTSYIYYHKRIPADLPVSIISETTIYPKR